MKNIFVKTALIILVLAWIFGYFIFLSKVDSYPVMSKIDQNRHLRAQAIVVLTGGANRINTGFDLLSRDIAKHLFITGVNKGISKAEIMESADIEIDEELLECCVHLGHKATNTKENASEAYRLIQNKGSIQSLILVTSDYHMPRSMYEFSTRFDKVKITPITVKSGLRDRNVWEYFKITFSEFNKLILTWFDKVVLSNVSL